MTAHWLGGCVRHGGSKRARVAVRQQAVVPWWAWALVAAGMVLAAMPGFAQGVTQGAAVPGAAAPDSAVPDVVKPTVGPAVPPGGTTVTPKPPALPDNGVIKPPVIGDDAGDHAAGRGDDADHCAAGECRKGRRGSCLEVGCLVQVCDV